jgi:hypothetical protein
MCKSSAFTTKKNPIMPFFKNDEKRLHQRKKHQYHEVQTRVRIGFVSQPKASPMNKYSSRNLLQK